MRRYKFGPQLGEISLYVKKEIVLEHHISEKGIEVDRTKIETIEKPPPPTNVRGMRSFLWHAEFYR